MRRKVLAIFLCLAFSVCVVACGKENNLIEPTETSSLVEVTEAIETEVVATESVEPTEVQESKTEVVETEAEEIVEVTEIITETETPQSLELTYEDFAFSYKGYTNYIDFESNTPEKHEIQIVFLGREAAHGYLCLKDVALPV